MPVFEFGAQTRLFCTAARVLQVEAGCCLSYCMGGISRCHLVCLDASLAAVTAAAAINPDLTIGSAKATAKVLPRGAVTQDPYELEYAGPCVASLAVNTGGFRFAHIDSIYDSNFLPGAQTYQDR